MILGVLMVLAMIFTYAHAPSAHADVFGEIGQRVGRFGTGPGEFKWPAGLAVDPSDNSVYVVDAPNGYEQPGTAPEFRIQKFDATLGAPVASVTIDTPEGAEGERWVASIAVDPTLKRLYVLVGEASQVNGYESVAKEIRVYSTKEETTGGGEKTLPPATGPGITGGVLHAFSVPPAADTVGNPVAMAFDPKTEGLLILGTDFAKHALIESVTSKGAVGVAYDDTESKLGVSGNNPTGLSAGPDGSVYLTVHYDDETQLTNSPGVIKLSPDFSTVTKVHQAPKETESPALTGGTDGGDSIDYGPQVAVNPEGAIVYATQVSKSETSGMAGSYEVRGMSTTTGSTEVVYGGGTTECLIASLATAVAAGSNGIVYALDEGAAGEITYGFHLIEFGPGGSNCPAPVTSIAVETTKTKSTNSGEKFPAQKGEKVEFVASSLELGNEIPTKLVWEATEGPETPPFKEEVTAGNPLPLTTSHRFLKPGLYTVTLNMTVSPGALGSPPPVARKIEVTAPPPEASFEASNANPKPGEEVTFNAEESVDPTGSCSASGCGPTHTLKSYTWNFGDGSPEVTTTEKTIKHAFANPASTSLADTVTLTVINEEEVESTTPSTLPLTIQGTPPSGPGPVLGGGGVTPSLGGGLPSTNVINPGPSSTKPAVVKPLTNAQKLAKALKACEKVKSKTKRASCVKLAKKKYGSKPKPKKKGGKK